MKGITLFSLFACLMLLNNQANAISELNWQTLNLKEQAATIDQLTVKRMETLLPRLMAENNIDMWLLISREYNEDPVLKTMLPATWLSARRRTILVLVKTADNKVKRLAVAPYKVGNIFASAWDKKQTPDQWQALNQLIAKYQPKTIGINQSQHWAHADGLVATDKQALIDNLSAIDRKRLVSAEKLAVAWLEQRIDDEVDIYRKLGALAHQIIAEGFSNKTITVGKTTTEDLVWWFREKVQSLGLQTWFHPSVSIQRGNNKAFDHESSFTNGYGEQVVLPGDLLHVDFGLTYLRLNTDTQQHAYVLKADEKSAPEYLVKAFVLGNQLQDIFTGQFSAGKTGNQVLKQSRSLAIAQGLKPTIYTHPLGLHGHAAGTTLGMWDAQDGVAGSGDYPLHLNTSYSIELNNAVFIKEWDKEIRIMLEEDAHFDSTGVWYFSGRQEELHLINSNN